MTQDNQVHGNVKGEQEGNHGAHEIGDAGGQDGAMGEQPDGDDRLGVARAGLPVDEAGKHVEG